MTDAEKAWQVECALVRYCHIVEDEVDLGDSAPLFFVGSFIHARVPALCGCVLVHPRILNTMVEYERRGPMTVVPTAPLRYRFDEFCPRCTTVRGGLRAIRRSPKGDRRLWIVRVDRDGDRG